MDTITLTRDEAFAAVRAAGATVHPSHVAFDCAESNDIEIMAWLLTVGLINEIQRGHVTKYTGTIQYVP